MHAEFTFTQIKCVFNLSWSWKVLGAGSALFMFNITYQSIHLDFSAHHYTLKYINPRYTSDYLSPTTLVFLIRIILVT